MSAAKFVMLECIAFFIAFGIWLGSGHTTYLFIAGMAFGAAVVGAVLGWEERKSIKAEMSRRVDA